MIMKWTLILAIIVSAISYFSHEVSMTARHIVMNYYIPVSERTDKVSWVKKSAHSKRPNVVLIIVDDLGFNDLTNSPNIQSIYKNGAKFNNAYAAHATCAPSRASIMTGKFSTKLGVEFTPHPISLDILMYFQQDLVNKNILNWTNILTNPTMESMSLNKNETLISNVLRDSGYLNYYLGKWHLGENEGHRPLERGYDESLSFLFGASVYGDKDDPNIISAPIERSVYDTYMTNLVPFGISHNNGKMFKPDKYMTDYLSDNAVDIINSKSESTDPFFITLAYNAPHNPYQALLSDYENETGLHHEKVYKAMIKAVDRGVGNVIEALKKSGKYENTLIVFTSDNGGTHLIGIDDINYPHNGWKCTFFEGGLRVPLFLQWPDKIPKETEYNKTVSHVDIFSTITSVVNYDDSYVDGKNLIAHVLKEENEEPHKTLFWRSGDYRLLKVDNWKLSISDHMNKQWLFNINKDPQELNNLINHVPHNETIKSKYNEMKEQLIEINSNQSDPLWKSPIMIPTPIYGSNITSKYQEFIFWSV